MFCFSNVDPHFLRHFLQNPRPDLCLSRKKMCKRCKQFWKRSCFALRHGGAATFGRKPPCRSYEAHRNLENVCSFILAVLEIQEPFLVTSKKEKKTSRMVKNKNRTSVYMFLYFEPVQLNQSAPEPAHLLGLICSLFLLLAVCSLVTV